MSWWECEGWRWVVCHGRGMSLGLDRAFAYIVYKQIIAFCSTITMVLDLLQSDHCSGWRQNQEHTNLCDSCHTPWDDSDDSFLTTTDQDDDTDSISSTTSSPTTNDPSQPHINIQNPYQQAPQPPPRSNIINSLWSWIQPQQPIQNPPHQQPNLPNPSAATTACGPMDHRTILQRTHHNQHWGNQMSLPKPPKLFCIISHNVNSLSNQFNYIQWKATAQAIHDIKAWTKIHHCRIQQILHHTTGHASISTTISSEISIHSHQRGGTLQALVGDWTSCIVTHGQDKSGLIRWSYLKLQGKNDQQFIILSGYRVGDNPKVDFGSNNTYNQQYQLLHQQGHRTPGPRTKFVDDIIQLIKEWQAQNKAILICLDANKNPQIPSTTGMHRTFTKTNLIDLHSHRHAGQWWPSTYNQGSNPINLCTGSSEFADALEAAWYLPFGEPIGLKGDHQTLRLNFNTDWLFWQCVNPIEQTKQHGMISNNMKLTPKFCNHTIKACQQANIFVRIHNLTACDQLSHQDQLDLEIIDVELTAILAKADQWCVKQGNHPWSPELHTA